MPIWAIFMRKAANDPNCGIDTKLTFVKPESMTNDIFIDYAGGTNAIPSGESEGDGTGGSKSDAYDVPKNIKMDDIGAESDTKLEDTKTIPPIAPVDKDKKKTGDKPAGTIPASLVPQKPKASMPPKKKPGEQ